MAQSPLFEWAIGLVIITNCIFLSLYRPLEPDDSPRNNMLNVSDIVFTIIFTIEMLIKMVAFGIRGYWRDNWNKMDLLVVISGYMALLPGTADSNVSSVRTIRVLRPLRTITVFPGLRILVSTILSSIPMIFNVIIVCIYLFVLFGILGIQAFEGKLRQRCVLYDGPGMDAKPVKDASGERVLELWPPPSVDGPKFCSLDDSYWHGPYCSDGCAPSLALDPASDAALAPPRAARPQ